MKKRLVLAVTTIFAEIFMWLLSMPLDITFQFFGTSTIRIHKLLRYALDACGSSLVFGVVVLLFEVFGRLYLNAF